jgi:hypothetical protein
VVDKPLFRDPVHDGAADPVVVYTGALDRWYTLYTNRRANAQGASGMAWMHGTRRRRARRRSEGISLARQVWLITDVWHGLAV